MHERCSVIQMTSLPFELEGAAPPAPHLSFRRSYPAHHPVDERSNHSIVVLLTVCTRGRKTILARVDAMAVLREAWAKATLWQVGCWVLMPDHAHLFRAPATMHRCRCKVGSDIGNRRRPGTGLEAPSARCGSGISGTGNCVSRIVTERNGIMYARIRCAKDWWIGKKRGHSKARRTNYDGADDGGRGAPPSSGTGFWRALRR